MIIINSSACILQYGLRSEPLPNTQIDVDPWN